MRAIAQSKTMSCPKASHAGVTSLHSTYTDERIVRGSEEVRLTTFLDEGLLVPERKSALENASQQRATHDAVTASITSATTPVRRNSMFSTDCTPLVRRPSSSHRMFVEKTLADVFSEACLKARAQVGQPSESLELLVGRSGSWGRATSTVLCRTSNVSSFFHRRSSVDQKAVDAGPYPTRLEGDHEKEGRSSSARGSQCVRATVPFPPTSTSMGRRRGTPVISVAVGEPALCEPEENGSEDLTTPASTVFPLTPDVVSFHEFISTVSPAGTVDSLVEGRFHSRSLSLRSKHVRTKSQGLAQNVRELLFRRRASLSSIEQSPDVMEDLITALGHPLRADGRDAPPTAPSCLEPTDSPRSEPSSAPATPLSLLQRGLAFMSRKRATSITDPSFLKGAEGRRMHYHDPKMDYLTSSLSTSTSRSDDTGSQSGDSIASLKTMLAIAPRTRSLDRSSPAPKREAVSRNPSQRAWGGELPSQLRISRVPMSPLGKESPTAETS